jgi:hypothetical protein
VLTIKLADNSTVSGKVTSSTDVECESAGATQMQNDDGSPGSGDNGGTSGDDNGGTSGDDNAGTTATTTSPTSTGDDNNDQGEDAGETGDGGVTQAACDTALGTAGTMVQEAELSIMGGTSTWTKIDLITP